MRRKCRSAPAWLARWVPPGRLKCHPFCGWRQPQRVAIKQSLGGLGWHGRSASEAFPPCAAKLTFFFGPIKTWRAGCCFPFLLCFVFVFFSRKENRHKARWGCWGIRYWIHLAGGPNVTNTKGGKGKKKVVLHISGDAGAEDVKLFFCGPGN